MILFAIMLVLWPSLALSTQYYIDDTGSNSNSGTTINTPWLTWAYAFANSACGDTLIVRNGTYTLAHTAFNFNKACTSSSPYTIKAENERQATIDGSAGNFIPLKLTGASYVTVEGLIVQAGDLAGRSGTDAGVCNAYNSNHITFRHMICQKPNGYLNAGHVIQLSNTQFSLIEENEIYSFHRHGVYIGANSNDNVIRRNYCNGRGVADLSGAGVQQPSLGPSTDHADDCYIVYPGSRNIFENNIAEGDMLKYFAVESISGGSVDNKFYGNIGLGGAWNGVALDARGNNSTLMVQNTTIEHTYIENTTNHADTSQTASAYRFNAVKAASCTNCTANATVDGFTYSNNAVQLGDGVYSGTLTNSLALNVQQATGSYSSTTGYGVFFGSGYTWTATNNNSYNSANADYNPATSANYSPNPNSAIDPQMGTCKVWQPDGSAAKINNWGANILYRYENGILGSVPLWDPTTGEFPHGAVIAGVNDLAGSSPFDVHTRLNVNTNGCEFPSGYAAGTPVENPGTYESSTGVNGTSHTHVIPAGTDALIVFVHLRDGGANVGTVNSVGGCGGEPLSFRGGATTTPGYHTVEVWGRLNPTPGTCTIIATTTGTVTSMSTTSIAQDDVVSFRGGGGGAGFSATPSVGIFAAPGDLLMAGTSAASAFSLSAGSGQTLRADTSNGPSRLAISTQLGPGSDGGTMDYVIGGVGYWAEALITLETGSSGSPSAATFTISKYRIYGLLGSTSTPEISLGALAAQDTAGHVGIGGAFRIRSEITVSVANSDLTAIALYCKKNAGSFARITNVFGGNDLRLYGPGTEANMPANLDVTTQRFSGTFSATGLAVRDDGLASRLGVTPNGSRLETDHLLVLGNAAAAGDTYACEIRRDDGSTLGVHTVTPTIVADGPSASMGF